MVAAQDGVEGDALVADVAAQGVGDADVPGAVLAQATGLRAVYLACDAPDRRLGLPLLGGGELEDLAQRAPHEGRVVLLFFELLLALDHLLDELGEAAQDLLALLL